MKLLIVAVVCLAVGCNALNLELDEDWNNFKDTYNKKYTHASEETQRRYIWERNVDKIASHNRLFDLGFRTFSLGINEYADLTHEEFRNTMNGFVASKHRDMNQIHYYNKKAELPDTVDWREKNAVTKVKDQLAYGSCWGFSAIGSVEGQHAIKTGQLVSLSVQQLVDCLDEGASIDDTFNYIRDNKGIDTEESYPSDGIKGKCRFRKDSIGATITGHVDLPTGDEKALQDAVANVGPVSVAIDASHEEFQLYRDGVLDVSTCSSQLLDHGVLVVGYGNEDGKDYWLVKNSWGTSWGIDGYVKMSRNKNNQCGIATMASYPTV